MTDAWIKALQRFPLQSVTLTNCFQLTEESLRSLETMRTLEHVDFPAELASTATAKRIRETIRARLRRGVVILDLSYGKADPNDPNLTSADDILLEYRDSVALEEVILDGARFSSNGVASLPWMAKLRKLSMRNAQGVLNTTHMKGLGGLVYLDVSGTEFGDKRLAIIPKYLPKLEYLDITKTETTPQGLKHLSGATALKTLKLPSWSETAEGRIALYNDVPFFGNSELDLSSTNATDADLAALEANPTITSLNLSHTSITDATIDALLEKQPQLQRLNLASTNVTNRALMTLAEAPNLTTLDVSDCPKLTDMALARLEQYPRLTQLVFSDALKTTLGLECYLKWQKKRRRSDLLERLKEGFEPSLNFDDFVSNFGDEVELDVVIDSLLRQPDFVANQTRLTTLNLAETVVSGEALEELYLDYGWKMSDVGPAPNHGYLFPTLEGLVLKIEQVVKRRGYRGEVSDNLLAATQGRLKTLMRGSAGQMLNCRVSSPLDRLFQYPAILELNDLNEQNKSLATMFILVFLREYRELHPIVGKLGHVTVVEEARNILEKTGGRSGDSLVGTDSKGKAVSAFCNMLTEVRSYGEGLIIADQSPEKLASDVMRNTNVQIAHQLRDSTDRASVANAMIMSDEQREFLGKLRPGNAAVFYTGLERASFISVPLYYGENAPSALGDGFGAVSLEELREHMKTDDELSDFRRYPERGDCDCDCAGGCLREEAHRILANLSAAIQRKLERLLEQLVLTREHTKKDALDPLKELLGISVALLKKEHIAINRRSLLCMALHEARILRMQPFPSYSQWKNELNTLLIEYESREKNR